MASVKKLPYIARGNQRALVVMTPAAFNIDAGSGTTVDYQLCNLPYDAYIQDVRAIYSEATDTAGAASANFKLGVAAGGATLVAATALEVSKAIGATTVATITLDYLPANTTLWVRHTGIAATEAGTYYVQVILVPKP
jgi:poly(3-hydroxyalkanoate) synthetase